MINRRKYQQQWRREHAEEGNAYQRRRRSLTYGAPATREEQATCSTDSRKSLRSKFGIVGADAVLCMLCWRRYREIPHHLPRCDKLPAEWRGADDLPALYRNHFHFGKHTALACEDVRVARRKVADKHGLAKYAKQDPHRNELLERIRPTSRPKRSHEYSLDLGDRMRGKRSARQVEAAVTDGDILFHWLVERRPVEVVAKKICKSERAVRARLRRIVGIEIRRGCEFSGGSPVTGRWLLDLLSRLGLTRPEFEEHGGFGKGRFYNALRGKHASAPLRGTIATEVVSYAEELICKLFTSAAVSKLELLKAVSPGLRAAYDRGRKALEALHDPVTCSERLDELATLARLEVASSGGPGENCGTLYWVPELARFLKNHPPKGSAVTPKPGKFMVKFLSLKFSCPEELVQAGLSDTGIPLTPATMRAAIIPILRDLPARRGRAFGKLKDTRERIKLAAAFDLQGWTHTEMAEEVFPDKPQSAVSNIYRFFHDYGKDIELTKLGLTAPQAAKIVKRAQNQHSSKTA